MSGRSPSGSGRRSGRFLGVPYEFSRPSWARLKAEAWDPSDRRVVKPKRFFGAWWAVNFRELARRLGPTR